MTNGSMGQSNLTQSVNQSVNILSTNTTKPQTPRPSLETSIPGIVMMPNASETPNIMLPLAVSSSCVRRVLFRWIRMHNQIDCGSAAKDPRTPMQPKEAPTASAAQ
mmetsp:Transcript_15551/g.33778  ORF Transcript_15551/g.33778 Transcript_15551/m.33778 type:complete len:106 (+) Transcript_15551:529-846(+)